VVLTIVVFGIAFATYSQYDPSTAAAEARFGQCYSGVPNCVVDGDTFQVAGKKVQIAGIVTPQISNAKCDAERSRGIDAATRLAELLNSGSVSAGPTFRDELGRDVRKVKVDGQDVAPMMIGAGVARETGSETEGWC
jgi:endonuclease YncB( thermonuclease family)